MLLKHYTKQPIQVHTLRIELIDGKALLYKINIRVKEELEKWLFDLADDLMEQRNVFLSFYAECDRFVFIKINCIKRIVFCWDMVLGGQEYPLYHDNYSVVYQEDEEPVIPELIIKIRNSNEPAIFDNLDPDSDLLGIDESSFNNLYFIKGGFLTVRDEDGDQNFIPMVNIECIEVNRVYVYPNEVWQGMQSQIDQENSGD